MSISRIPQLCLAQHDPNAGLQGKWTIEVEIPEGFTLIGPVTVIAVLPDGTDTPLADDSLAITSITIGQITTSPNVWGISFDTEGGATQTYWLRGAARRTNGASTYGVQRTVRMPSGNN